MDKIKARVITVAVMLMLGAMAWMTLQGSIRGFRVLEGFFAAYGFLSFGGDLYRWMQLPAREPKEGRRARG